MAKEKKKAKPDAGDEGAKPSKLGKIMGLLSPLLVFGAAFGAHWQFGAAPSEPVVAQEDTMTADSKPAVDWAPPPPAYIVSLDPMTVTIGQQGKLIKIGLALEAATDEIDPSDPRLKDAFTGYLRAIEPDMLSDPNFHIELKRQLLHRARVTLGMQTVQGVLITDFLMT